MILRIWKNLCSCLVAYLCDQGMEKPVFILLWAGMSKYVLGNAAAKIESCKREQSSLSRVASVFAPATKVSDLFTRDFHLPHFVFSKGKKSHTPGTQVIIGNITDSFHDKRKKLSWKKQWEENGFTLQNWSVRFLPWLAREHWRHWF